MTLASRLDSRISPEDEVRPSVGIVGAGVQMYRHLVPAIKAYGADISAVFDVDPKKAFAFATDLGVKATLSLDELLERSDIDCVVAACTPQGHEGLIAAATARGVPVLVEKPPARNLSSLQRLIAASADAGVPVCVGMNYRNTPGFDALREFARTGGPLRYIHVQHLATTGAGPAWGLGRLRTLLLAQAVHALDLALLLIGECSASSSIVHSSDGQLCASWTISGESAVCNILVSSLAPGFRQVVTVLCNDGTVAELTNLDQLDVMSEAGYRAYQHLQIRRAPFADVLDRMGFASTVTAFLDTHVTRRPEGQKALQPISLRDLEPTYVLIEQAITAARSSGGMDCDDD
jgi:phthalate 4,5-cis-dihydrodiol dehydrogenase